MRTINKFTKLTVLFSALYLLICLFMSSNIYSTWVLGGSIPRFGFGSTHLSIIALTFLGCLIASIILGIIATIKTYRTKEKGIWITVILTLFNVLVLMLNIIGATNYLLTL